MKRAPRLCSCGLTIAHSEMCPCQRRRAAQRHDARPPSAARGYDAEWRAATAGFLAAHPFCCDCAAKGITTPATVVGHIVSIRIDPSRRLDPTNWKPVCRGCNARDAHRDRRGRGGAKAFSQPPETTALPLTRDNPSFFSPTTIKSETDEWPW